MDLSLMERTGFAAAPPSIACRLCDSPSDHAFGATLIGKHPVSYYRCRDCGCLQTETPYWLEEAYAAEAGGTANLADLDTGAAQRNLMSLAAVMLVAKHLKLRNVVDHGGGDGLLVRLLRDYGLNAYVQDRYATATYGRGFGVPDFDRPDLVTAFEVFEHFENPKEEIAALFVSQPKAVLITTEIYTGQAPDWWYLVPDTGQHIFFYSEGGMKLLAERFGYALIRSGSYTLFVRPEILRGARFLKHGLRFKALKLLRSVLLLRPARGSDRDFNMLKERHGSQPRPGEG